MRVTNLVSLVYESDFLEWQMKMRQLGLDPDFIRDESARIGTEVHKNIQRHYEKKKITSTDVNIMAATMAGIRAIEETNIKPISWEDHLFKFDENNNYQYDGHSDIIGTIKGVPWLIDIKTYGLYDKHRDDKCFRPMSPDQKKKTNLQTWMYAQCGKGSVKPEDLRRGCIHANQYGWEFVEFKRKPIQKTLDKLNYFITQNTW